MTRAMILAACIWSVGCVGGMEDPAGPRPEQSASGGESSVGGGSSGGAGAGGALAGGASGSAGSGGSEEPATPQLFVSTSGDDANPGTLSAPWRTIQKAMSSAPPGATVNIRSGTYAESLVLEVSGAPGEPITFQPYGFSGAPDCGGWSGVACGGEEVSVDYAHLGINTSTTPLFLVSGRSHVRIRGLAFRNLTCSGPMQQLLRIDEGSSFIEFSHNRFLDNRNIHPSQDGTAALLHIRIWPPSSDITFYANEIGNVATSMSEALTASGVGTTRIRFEKNWIHDTDGIAIDLHGGASDYLVRANKVEYAGKLRDGSWSYGVAHAAIYNDGANSGIIERNIVLDSGYAFQALSEPGQPATHDVVIRNNVAARCEAGLLLGTWYSSSDGSTVSDIKAFNNTFHANAIGVLIRPMVSSSVVWKNNLFFGNATNYANPLGWDPGAADYNGYFGSNVGPGSNNLTADPKLSNVAAHDYALLPGSPAVNAGDPSSTLAAVGELDHSGNSRIRNGRVDIGAHELQ
jgi:hypothetical protein